MHTALQTDTPVSSIFFLLYAVAALFGFGVLLFAYAQSIRSSNGLLRAYGHLLVLLFLFFITEALEIYGFVSLLPGLGPDSLFSIVFYRVIEGAAGSYLVLLATRLRRMRFSTLHAVAGILFFIAMLITVPWDSHGLQNLSDYLFAFWIVLWATILLFRPGDDRTPNLKKVVRTMSAVLLSFTPCLLLGDLLPQVQEMGPYFSVVAVLLFYLVWNSLTIAFYLRYYKDESSAAVSREIPRSFIDRYQITSRESEVAAMLIRGLTNKEIAFELRISPKTVKNHIYSIYRKAEIQSRIELVWAIQPRSD